MTDITKTSLTDIVGLIKKKEIKSEEVTTSFINNIKKDKKLTFKGLFILNDLKFPFSFPRQNKNWGGSSDKLVNEFTVHPKYFFFEVPLVIIVTPVEKREKT